MSKPTNALDTIKQLAKERGGSTAPKTKESKNSKKLETIPKIDGRKNNKGGPGGGRPPKEITLIKRGIKQFVDEHVNEDVEVTLSMKDGSKKIVKIPRVKSVLLKLYELGVGATEKGNASALKEWLDRALGKAPQPIRGDGDDDTPIHMEIDIGKILKKAYDDED